jgi:two-component system OmpR family response regulator
MPHPVNNPPRVVVAEDDAEMRRLVVEVLVADGCVVEQVPDGGRLLVELSHQIPRDLEAIDLIVSDIRMPVTSGLSILEALRAAHCWTPVILMTAFGDDATRARAEMLGALLFDKPFDLDDLRTAVMNLLHRDSRAP